MDPSSGPPSGRTYGWLPAADPPAWQPGNATGYDLATAAVRRTRRRRLVLPVLALFGLVTVATGAVLAVPHLRAARAQHALDAELPALEGFVAHERGLAFVRPVRVRLLDDAAFRRSLGGAAVRPAGDDEDATLHGLGQLAQDVGLDDAELQTLGDGVGGYYDVLSGSVTLRGARLDDAGRYVLVHELTHAVQYQHLGLGDLTPHGEGDQRSAWDALVEGDATRVAQAWLSTQPAEVRDELGDGSVDSRTGSDVDETFLFPYAAGPAYVRALLLHGGQPALDAAFRDPPTTTRQVLHPGRDAGATLPLTAGLPAGEVLDRGVLGEAGLARLLGRDPLVDGPQAGWSADRFATVRESGGTCTYDDIAVTSVADRDALLVVLQGWAEGRDHAAVTATGPSGLRLRSCSDG